MSTKKGNKVKKKLKLTGLLGAALLVLTACGTSQVTAQSTGGWERFVYFFAEAIRFLSFGGSIGVGIIVFTIVIRTVLLPLFQYQMNSTRKMQEIQPLLKELQAKYPGRILIVGPSFQRRCGPFTRKKASKHLQPSFLS